MEEEEEEEGVGGKRKTIFAGLISAIRALCERGGGFTDITKIDAIMLCSLTRSVFSKIVNWSITKFDIK